MRKKRIFIENQPSEIFRRDETAKYYEERCLSLAEDKDVVITTQPIDIGYIGYLKKLGLDLECEFLNPHRFEQDLAYSILKDAQLLSILKEKTSNNNYTIETYIPGNSLSQLSELLSIPISFRKDIYDNYSTKTGFRMLGNLLNLPLPQGIITSYQDFPANGKTFIDKNTSVILKHDASIGSLGIYSVSDKTVVEEILRNEPDELFVLEATVNTVWNGSVQFIVRNSDIHMFIDECIVEKTRFRGFIFPASFPNFGAHLNAPSALR